MDLVWTCKCCGKQYNSLPFAYALDEPDPWLAVPEAERPRRGALSSDGCVIDGKQFCVRGRVEIPVIGSEDSFIWGIWVSVSKESFDRIGELWETQIREHEPPLSGALCSDIPIYGQTTGLKCKLHLRNAGRRPSIKLEPADHLLAVEQHNGITIERVKEIAAAVLRHSE
jgi:hypothetical protein